MEGGEKKQQMEKKTMEPNHGHDKQRERVNESVRGGWRERGDSLKVLNSINLEERGNRTVSTEALGESGRVGDVIGRVLLWHQGDHRAICHLRIKTQQRSQRTYNPTQLSTLACARFMCWCT